MSTDASPSKLPAPPSLPRPVVSVGLTGHRRAHSAYPADDASLAGALAAILAMIENAARDVSVHGQDAPVSQPDFRLVTLLADGADQLATRAALQRNWSVCAPLPFGAALNAAIGSSCATSADARAILEGKPPSDAATAQRTATLSDLAQRTRVFELADRDEAIKAAFIKALEHPADAGLQTDFVHATSARYQLAGRILIEQCDVLIAVWDGKSTINPGGTGDTARRAAEAGVPVIWINPADGNAVRIVTYPEALRAHALPPQRVECESAITALVQAIAGLEAPDATGSHAGFAELHEQKWRDASSFSSHAYRRVETLFGEPGLRAKFRSIRQHYERPDGIENGEFAGLLEAIERLDGDTGTLRRSITRAAIPRFVWANARASQLADRYRSGMVANFTMGALAIISGVLYLPLVDTSQKWIFAAVELALLLAIVGNTMRGQRYRLHGRWLETRRVAEYLRHSAVLYTAGVARPAGAWPRALRSQWPEWYARMTARELGLPAVRVDADYLRRAASALRDHFVAPQLSYHTAKSARLHRAHHAIEHLAERLFAVAIGAVAIYLGLAAASGLGLIEGGVVKALAKWFTVIAVTLPTVSGALAAISYFADFDRFADISKATAGRLEELQARIDLFLQLADETLDYAHFADLSRTADTIAFDEIQAWQAVFSGKRITVPS